VLNETIESVPFPMGYSRKKKEIFRKPFTKSTLFLPLYVKQRDDFFCTFAQGLLYFYQPEIFVSPLNYISSIVFPSGSLYLFRPWSEPAIPTLLVSSGEEFTGEATVFWAFLFSLELITQHREIHALNAISLCGDPGLWIF